MVANWDIQRPVFLNVASDVSRTVNEKGEVLLTGGVSGALLAHFVLVSMALGVGFVALVLGCLTFRAKPLFKYQALVHKNIGRLWVWIMVVIGFQSAFIVEAGTPLFVVAFICVLYVTMILGVQTVRSRGDLRDHWNADKDSIVKDEQNQKKRDIIIRCLKIAHATFMGISYLVLFITASALSMGEESGSSAILLTRIRSFAAVARYPGVRSRYGQVPYATSTCFLDPKSCLGTQICYPSWMNALSAEANATVLTLNSPYAPNS